MNAVVRFVRALIVILNIGSLCYYHNILLVIVYIISYKLVVIISVFIVYSHIVYASLT